ncbi:MAG: sugar phosphate isomerase/epimerase family protein [Bacteroidota bacterium]|nr:sugar phosphate isomerase/epimerase family protein [Bacteroidota bacterium]
MKRRDAIRNSALMAAMINTGYITNLVTKRSAGKIRIGACDWSLGMDSDPAAFDLAKQIGLAGVQVNLGSLQNNLHLREKPVQETYLEISRRTGVAIAGLAIGELNNVPYKSDARTDQWVSDSIDVASALGVKVILLAFFSNNDLRNDDAGKKEVIRKLKLVAPKAEKLGVILGIESYLSAEEVMDIIRQIGSRNVKVFYDFRNAADAGYDVIREIKWLGKNNICELHMKENGQLLGKGTMDWEKICNTLIEMDYYGDGWMQIEWAVPRDADLIKSYRNNMQFLRNCFHY